MAEDEGRASRIAELKSQHPRLTWGKIANHVGVTERSAIKWQKTGALETENAEKLAELFGVDFDYLWFGPRPGTPDMFVDRRNSHKEPVVVDRVEGGLEERITAIEATLAGITELLQEARVGRGEIRALLDRQDKVLKNIEDATRIEKDVRQLLDASLARVDEAIQTALALGREPEHVPPSARRARGKTAS